MSDVCEIGRADVAGSPRCPEFWHESGPTVVHSYLSSIAIATGWVTDQGSHSGGSPGSTTHFALPARILAP